VLGIDENIRHIRYHRHCFFHLFIAVSLRLQCVLIAMVPQCLVLKACRIRYVFTTIGKWANFEERDLPRNHSRAHLGRQLEWSKSISDTALAATKRAA
jgi:hypothetical protein